MKKITAILLAGIFFANCSNDITEAEELDNETPTALEEKSNFAMSSYKDRSYSDIIERLYLEAVEKNKTVFGIDSSIVRANQYHIDSLKAYHKYVTINEDYWETANRYIAEISDTVARKSIKKVFDNAELNYCDAKKGLISLNDKIKLEKEHFDNQVLLLKLAVTLPMIQNYQHNELPDTIPLKEILTGFGNANNKVTEFVKK